MTEFWFYKFAERNSIEFMNKVFFKYNNILFSKDFVVSDQTLNLLNFIEQNSLSYFSLPNYSSFIKKSVEQYGNKKVKIMIKLLVKEESKINFEIRGNQSVENLEQTQISSLIEEKTKLFQEEFKFFFKQI